MLRHPWLAAHPPEHMPRSYLRNRVRQRQPTTPTPSPGARARARSRSRSRAANASRASSRGTDVSTASAGAGVGTLAGFQSRPGSESDHGDAFPVHQQSTAPVLAGSLPRTNSQRRLRGSPTNLRTSRALGHSSPVARSRSLSSRSLNAYPDTHHAGEARVGKDGAPSPATVDGSSVASTGSFGSNGSPGSSSLPVPASPLLIGSPMAHAKAAAPLSPSALSLQDSEPILQHVTTTPLALETPGQQPYGVFSLLLARRVRARCVSHLYVCWHLGAFARSGLCWGQPRRAAVVPHWGTHASLLRPWVPHQAPSPPQRS